MSIFCQETGQEKEDWIEVTPKQVSLFLPVLSVYEYKNVALNSIYSHVQGVSPVFVNPTQLPTLPEHLSSLLVFSGVCVT
jgi:hypothetical protein